MKKYLEAYQDNLIYSGYSVTEHKLCYYFIMHMWESPGSGEGRLFLIILHSFWLMVRSSRGENEKFKM